ncbi:unnamed protein product, partial [Urochloa humidicola]
AISGECTQEGDPFVLSSVNIVPHASNGPSVPQLLHRIGNGDKVSSLDKQEALQQLARASTNKDNFIWTKKDSMEESIEIVLEKLLHVTKDDVAKVSNEAHQCLYVVLAKYDPFRCLAIILPLLASDD